MVRKPSYGNCFVAKEAKGEKEESVVKEGKCLMVGSMSLNELGLFH